MGMMNILPFEKSYLQSEHFLVTSGDKILNNNITKRTILKHSYNFCFYCHYYLHFSCFSVQMLGRAPNTDTQCAFVGKYIFLKAANLISLLSQTVNFFSGALSIRFHVEAPEIAVLCY